jgi:hypothetical protein
MHRGNVRIFSRWWSIDAAGPARTPAGFRSWKWHSKAMPLVSTSPANLVAGEEEVHAEA